MTIKHNSRTLVKEWCTLLVVAVMVAGTFSISLEVRAEDQTEIANSTTLLKLGLQSYQKGDYIHAMMYFKQSYEAGDAQAPYWIALMYENGQGVGIKKFQEAVEWYRRSAARGCADAQYWIGLYYGGAKGGTDKDLTLAVKWLTMAAQQGHVMSQYALGKYYFDTGAYDNALPWLRLAEKSKNEPAMNLLDVMYQKELIGAPKDIQEKLTWLLVKANKGDRNAQMRLYELYTLRTSQEEAARWLREAQENGHPRALALLTDKVNPEVNPYILDYQRQRRDRNNTISRQMNSVSGQQFQKELYRSRQ